MLKRWDAVRCWQCVWSVYRIWYCLALEHQSSCRQDRPNQRFMAWSLHRFTCHTHTVWLQPVISTCYVSTHSSLTLCVCMCVLLWLLTEISDPVMMVLNRPHLKKKYISKYIFYFNYGVKYDPNMYFWDSCKINLQMRHQWFYIVYFLFYFWLVGWIIYLYLILRNILAI